MSPGGSGVTGVVVVVSFSDVYPMPSMGVVVTRVDALVSFREVYPISSYAMFSYALPRALPNSSSSFCTSVWTGPFAVELWETSGENVLAAAVALVLLQTHKVASLIRLDLVDKSNLFHFISYNMFITNH